MPIIAIMALRRFIYVFVLPFLSFLISTTDCSALGKSGKEINAASNIRESYRDDHSKQSLAHGIIHAFDEGMPALERNNSTNVRVQARERDNVLFDIPGHDKWFSGPSLYTSFIPALRDELHTFIPIAQLLVFPKHWFW